MPFEPDAEDLEGAEDLPGSGDEYMRALSPHRFFSPVVT